MEIRAAHLSIPDQSVENFLMEPLITSGGVQWALLLGVVFEIIDKLH